MLCALYNYSRQAWYDRQKRHNEASEHEAVVIRLVVAQRTRLQTAGGKKLYVLLKATLQAHGIKMGRDKFIAVLGKHGLLQPRLKRRGPATTDSAHWFRTYPNLIKELEIKRPEQVWVSDMTYLRCEKGFYYLWLITDAYSKRIMGYSLDTTQEASGSVRALRMAIAARQYDGELTHHSDRGKQYCSNQYVKALRGAGIDISMTEEGRASENAIAERINRTLKQEFALRNVQGSLAQARRLVNKAVRVYNNVRPHLSCGMLTPDQAHRQSTMERKVWKRKKRSYPLIHSSIKQNFSALSPELSTV